MKKLLPFLLTGLLSAGLALGLFAVFFKPRLIIQQASPRALWTNYSPFDEAPSAVTVGLPDMIRASNQAKAAVVYIESSPTGSGYFSRRSQEGSTGSGVIVSANGYIATNYHVIEDGEAFKVLLDDGREYDADFVGSDKSTDLALLKVNAADLPYLTFGDSDSLMVGEWVMAIGNPFRLYSTVTAGIVSAKSRNINILDDSGIESFIQTDAAVNPGNSGGALVNTKGQLMGINTAIMTYSGQYEGFSFAIPANLARKVLEDLRAFGAVKRGWLGVVIRPVDNEVARANGLDEIAGVHIESVNPGSAAARAGLLPGDIVTHIDGAKVTSSPDFMAKVGQHRPGDELRIDYIRNKKKQQARVELSESRGETGVAETSIPPDDILVSMGLDVRDLSEAETERLPKSGVIVSAIKENSRADMSNMERNFIITEVNGARVKSKDDLKRELKRSRGGLYLKGYYERFPGDFLYTLDLY